jgi:hypothetical protein
MHIIKMLISLSSGAIYVSEKPIIWQEQLLSLPPKNSIKLLPPISSVWLQQNIRCRSRRYQQQKDQTAMIVAIPLEWADRFIL